MNAFQHKLRWLIIAGSTLSFLGGWGLLAQAGKSVVTNNSTTSVQQINGSLQLPPIDFKALESASSNLQSFSQTPSITFSPMLRTGGS